MIDPERLARWRANSRTDEKLTTYVLSDIREMLGEIDRLNTMLNIFTSSEPVKRVDQLLGAVNQTLGDIKASIEKWRDVLKFYADQENYKYSETTSAAIAVDHGAQARAILGPLICCPTCSSPDPEHRSEKQCQDTWHRPVVAS